MIEVSLAVLEGLIGLRRLRQPKSGREVFDDHIEPTFLDMTVVHTNYLRSLGELQLRLEDSDPQTLYQIVQARQAELAAVRTKLIVLAEAITENEAKWPEELVNFAEACNEYFRIGTELEPRRTAYAGLLTEIERILGNPERDSAEVAVLVKESLLNTKRHLDLCWNTVTTEYATARLTLLR